MSFVTPSGTLHPLNYQGIVLSPGQLVVEDVASEVQNMSSVSTAVATRTGRVVASELQTFSGPSTGLSLLPGAIVPQAQWVIPQSQETAGGVWGSLRVQSGESGRIGDCAPAAGVGPAALAGRPDCARKHVDPGDELADAHSRQRHLHHVDRRHREVPAWWWRGWWPFRRRPRRHRPEWAMRWTASPRPRLRANGSSRRPALRSTRPPAAPHPNTSPWRTSPVQRERFAAFALTASGTKPLASGVLGTGVTAIVSGSTLVRRRVRPHHGARRGPHGGERGRGAHGRRWRRHHAGHPPGPVERELGVLAGRPDPVFNTTRHG